ncbi:MAG: carbonate dehydratase [Thiohalomonadales bacterium]
MDEIDTLFEKNLQWAEDVVKRDKNFFKQLVGQQHPKYLWIGCSDSRVPANEIVGLAPGELFVHRNVANLVIHTDLNCLSVMQYAVDVLQVEHIIVCGHYGCGGITAALQNERHGLVDAWLQHVKDVRSKYRDILRRMRTEQAQHGTLCELNVIEQVVNVSNTTIVQDAWERGQKLAVHGWIYSINDGVIRDLNITVAESKQLKVALQVALDRLA